MDQQTAKREHRGEGDPTVEQGGQTPGALETVVARLRADNEGLRTSLRHRAVIEQAKGVLIARTGCSPDQAFERLVQHSQRANQKLVRVAAAVVGAAVTARSPVAVADGFDIGALFAPVDGQPSATARADERLAGAALEAALDLHELAQTIAFEAALDLGPEAALLGALEPDGAVRLVAGVGYDGQMMSAWHRIPPTVEVPLIAAARTHRPVLLADVATRVEQFPATATIPSTFEAQASIPMRANGSTVGVIGLSWADVRTFDAADERRLTAIAEQAVGPFLRLLRAGGDDLPQVAVEVMRTRWFQAALDAVLAPAFLLTPVRDAAGTLVDFEVAYVNRQGLGDVAPDRIVGQTVLALYPRTAGTHMFDVFREVLDSGAPAHLERVPAAELVDGTPVSGAAVELSVAPLGDGLLVSWRFHDA
ncbi:MAG: ANTAR domain-containing protein [Actinobacteria bacterium]|nr:ANTAR domain-containing protein [Actinomycetota bacterium]